jgi:hypothetical protein
MTLIVPKTLQKMMSASAAAKFLPPKKPFSATSLTPAGWQFRIVCHLLKQALLSPSNLNLSPFPARPL